MKIDTADWKWFQLGGKNGLFEIKKGKRLTSAEQTDGNTPYIGAIDSNNGLSNLIGQPPIHTGNTITLSYNGSVGEAFYQPVPYWATDDVNALYLRPKYGTLNPSKALFICTVLKHEKYRYAYGRKWTLENMNAAKIKLPATADGNPDWQWMEAYIDSLHSKPITTKNDLMHSGKIKAARWEKFLVAKIFDSIEVAKSADIRNLDPGEIPFIGRTHENNGQQGLVAPICVTSGHCITISMVGTNVAQYQESDFQASQNIAVLRKKELSRHAALFICTVINHEMKYKYSYGRTVSKSGIEQMILRLPATPSGTPDWQFMENYMKSLPYGDRI